MDPCSTWFLYFSLAILMIQDLLELFGDPGTVGNCDWVRSKPKEVYNETVSNCLLIKQCIKLNASTKNK